MVRSRLNAVAYFVSCDKLPVRVEIERTSAIIVHSICRGKVFA